MEMKQIITATVAVMLICLVAIPLIDSSKVNIQSEIQNTTERYSAVTGALTEDLTYTIDENHNVLLNGEIIKGTYDDTNQVHQIICMADNLTIFRNNAPATVFIIFDTNQSVYKEGPEFTLKTDGTYTFTTSSSGDITGNYSGLVYACNNGTLGIFSDFRTLDDDPVSVWINDESKMWLQVTYFDSTTKFIVATYSGTYDNLSTLVDYKQVPETTYTYDTTPIIVDSTPFSKEITYTPTITVNGEDQRCWNVQIIAPLTYTGYSENDSIVLSLIDIIPVLLIAALLIGIGYTIMRRD